ncbi:hypothetical protein ASG29_13640 [Sphingomonas sp. Leaf412]|nr:hypothetical protein ASG29_13640 [Sphingomonas sp. Leaf412]
MLGPVGDGWPGDGTSTSGAGGVTSGGGASGWTGCEGCGTSGGVVAIWLLLLAPSNAQVRTGLPDA